MHRVLNNLVEKMWDEDCDRLYGALRTQQRILKVRKETELPKTWENPEEWYRFHYDIYIYIYRRGLVNSIPWDDESSKIMEFLKNRKKRRPVVSETCWKSVCAGHSLNDRRVPVFKNGGVTSGEAGGCAWLPLARRVDLDRVYNTLVLREDLFQEIRTSAAGHAAAIST